MDIKVSRGPVVSLGSGNGSHLMTIAYYRLADGSINAVLEEMPVHVIERHPTISMRFAMAAQWSVEGALSLMRQCVRFDDETRAANED